MAPAVCVLGTRQRCMLCGHQQTTLAHTVGSSGHSKRATGSKLHTNVCAPGQHACVVVCGVLVQGL